MTFHDFCIGIGIALIAFYSGGEYREYTQKREVCKALGTVALAIGGGREIPADHPCRPYL